MCTGKARKLRAYYCNIFEIPIQVNNFSQKIYDK